MSHPVATKQDEQVVDVGRPNPDVQLDEWEGKQFGRLGYGEVTTGLLLSVRPRLSWHDADDLLRGGATLEQSVLILL